MRLIDLCGARVPGQSSSVHAIADGGDTETTQRLHKTTHSRNYTYNLCAQHSPVRYMRCLTFQNAHSDAPTIAMPDTTGDQH